MVILTLFLLLVFCPASGQAFIFTDPVASAQRAIQIAEQKIQTLQTYKIFVETIKNVEAVKLQYQMAKAGYEKLRNPREWQALGEYAQYRLKADRKSVV